MKNKLDDKNIELGKILFETKECLDLCKLLNLNIGKILCVGTGKSFFGFVHRSVVKLYAINICKIYEKENNQKKNSYKLNSIFGILNFINKNDLRPRKISYIQDFISRNNGGIVSIENCYEGLTSLAENFALAHSKDFELYKTWRDKHIAHAEDTDKQIKSLPSYDAMEKILFFAIDFYSTITKGFSENTSPHDYRQETRTITAFHRLLEETGCADIERDYQKGK
jgi:AbiU2